MFPAHKLLMMRSRKQDLPQKNPKYIMQMED